MNLIPLEAHLAQVLAKVTPREPLRVPLLEAHGCVLAAPVIARVSLPGFDNSGMDGYAVRYADVQDARETAPVRLRVVGDVPAGSSADPALAPGTCARVMTGAPIPHDADAVVPFEATTLGTAVTENAAETIDVTSVKGPGAHIRRAGEDIAEGTELLAAGTELGARAIATLAAGGVGEVEVVRRPRVAVIATGDELLDPTATDVAALTPARGQLYDSNTPLMALLAKEAGAEVIGVFRTDDSGEHLLEVVEAACERADVVITTGGVSVGAFDVVRLRLSDRGVNFTKVAMQPGKPQGFGQIGNALVFCLPGNPVSAMASFEAFVRPALRRMRGELGPTHDSRMAVVGEEWRTPAGRAQLMPVRWTDGDTIVPAHSGGSGSHMVGRIARADGLAVVPADCELVRVGDQLEVWEMLR